MKSIYNCLLAFILMLAMLLLTGCSDKELDRDTPIYFYPQDYEENIYENPAYMEKVTGVLFTNEGITVMLDENDVASVGLDAKLFLEYFNAIKDGNAEKANSFIADDYFSDDNPKKEKFTMQKLYDIEVSFVQNKTMEYNDADTTVRDYLVRYKIMYNNGSFRNDLPSDASAPQHYLVGDVDGKSKILNILDIDYKEG